MPASAPSLDSRIEAVRRFSRFYTRQLGILNEGLLDSPYSLTEARVIYELAHHGETTASELSSELALDAGYLSRILNRLGKAGLIARERSPEDGRRTMLRLSREGEEAFALLNARSRHQIAAMLGRLGAQEGDALVNAMATVERLLGAPDERRVPLLLRPHQPGDMGWVVHRHAVLYAEEYGFDQTFEALVAKVVAEFIENFKPERERCWIAEVEGAVVGSVFVVQNTPEVAQLRLLLIEPQARGLGLGRRLVAECIRFARAAGYRRMRLWTNDCLTAARAVYEKAGFVITESEPHHSFGQDLVGEIWELDLEQARL
jgi:DNA-binding MarR family transcriptional regulator/N-acetylglutamate synthase-like GNAT family acetyltransferase